MKIKEFMDLTIVSKPDVMSSSGFMNLYVSKKKLTQLTKSSVTKNIVNKLTDLLSLKPSK